MEADFSIELAGEDETLEFPWRDPESRLHYFNLKRHPELLLEMEEARQWPELAEFLASVNSAASQLESAKCDAWFTSELGPEDEIFGSAGKFGGYIDLVFSATTEQLSLPAHERLARKLTQLLKLVPEIPAAAELLIRRCYYHAAAQTTQGFYFTLYLFGYGDDPEQSRQSWAIALKLLANALQQCRHEYGRPTR